MSSQLILLLGGARAGKSAHASRLAEERQRSTGAKICFIATAQPLDEDMTARITRHREQRPADWQTIEEPYQIDDALRQAGEAGVVIVDCLTLFVSNWLLRHEDEHESAQFVRRITRDLLELARLRQQTIICVSNEVGLGVVPDTRLGRVFRDLLGRVNQDFSEAADEVYLLVAGIALAVKSQRGQRQLNLFGQTMDNPFSLIKQVCDQIEPIDQSWLNAARERQLTLTKPPGSLGRLEEIANRLAAIQRTVTPCVTNKRIYVVAGDHGVTGEGVSAYPREVTAQMVDNFLRGGAAINVLARAGGIEVRVVDAGVDADLSDWEELIHAKTIRGTANFAVGPAMARAEAEACVAAGIELARTAADDGIDLLGIGEMGIGNTTTASAITAVLLGRDPETVTGRGTGIDNEGLTHKIAVIRRALEINEPDAGDAMDILAKVGGAEIGLMAGIVLGAAANHLPLVADGFISTAAAALALTLEPNARDYLFNGHRSAERGHTALIEFIGEEPLLDLSMRLGEGTGAALAMHIIEGAVKLLSEMATFGDAGVSNKE